MQGSLANHSQQVVTLGALPLTKTSSAQLSDVAVLR